MNRESNGGDLTLAIVVTVIFWPVGVYLLWRYFHNKPKPTPKSHTDRTVIKTESYRGVDIDLYGKEHVQKFDNFINQHIRNIQSIAKTRAKNMRYKEIDNFNDIYTHIFPKNDNKTCPNCGLVFDKPLSRGKICPDCKTKLSVRSGIILTDKQLKQSEKWITNAQKLYEPLRIREILPTDHNFSYTDKLIEISRLYFDLEMYDQAWQLIAHDSQNIIPYEDRNDSNQYYYRRLSKARAMLAFDEALVKKTDKSYSHAAELFILFVADELKNGTPTDDFDIEYSVDAVKKLRSKGNVSIGKLINHITDLQSYDQHKGTLETLFQ